MTTKNTTHLLDDTATLMGLDLVGPFLVPLPAVQQGLARPATRRFLWLAAELIRTLKSASQDEDDMTTAVWAANDLLDLLGEGLRDVENAWPNALVWMVASPPPGSPFGPR